MPKVSWSFNINEKSHNVELYHGYFSGKRRITVDDRIIIEGSSFKDFGDVYDFKIEKQAFRISIKPNFLSWNYFFETVNDQKD